MKSASCLRVIALAVALVACVCLAASPLAASPVEEDEYASLARQMADKARERGSSVGSALPHPASIQSRGGKKSMAVVQFMLCGAARARQRVAAFESESLSQAAREVDALVGKAVAARVLGEPVDALLEQLDAGGKRLGRQVSAQGLGAEAQSYLRMVRESRAFLASDASAAEYFGQKGRSERPHAGAAWLLDGELAELPAPLAAAAKVKPRLERAHEAVRRRVYQGGVDRSLASVVADLSASVRVESDNLAKFLRPSEITRASRWRRGLSDAAELLGQRAGPWVLSSR